MELEIPPLPTVIESPIRVLLAHVNRPCPTFAPTQVLPDPSLVAKLFAQTTVLFTQDTFAASVSIPNEVLPASSEGHRPTVNPLTNISVAKGDQPPPPPVEAMVS